MLWSRPRLVVGLTLVLAFVPAAASAAAPGTGIPQKGSKKVEIPVQVPVEPGSPRAWVLLAGAVPAERGHFRHDLLAGAELRAENVEAMRQFLEQRWKVKRRIDLLNTIDDLQQNGRRLAIAKNFAELRNMKITEKQIDELWKGEERDSMRTLFRNAARLEKEKEGLLAWDLVECIVLIRQGYAAGYIEEAEAWRRLEVLGKRLQKAYESFEEIGEIWCIGDEIGDAPGAKDARAALEKLKTEEKSPWQTTPWNLKLAKLEAPQPPSTAPTKPSSPEPGTKPP